MGQQPDSIGSPIKTIAILGGGLAGLSATRSLLERGYQVTLVEKRPFLGGRAFSFKDSKSGSVVDNGQHIFMGCCSYYIDFIKALGVEDKTFIQDRLRTEVILDGKLGVLGSTPWLGQLHLLPSFIRYPHISFTDKLRVVYGLIRVKLTNRSKNAEKLDCETYYDWLKRHHQTDRAIENMWNLIILATLNDDSRDVGADMALMVLQDGLLKKPSDAAIGFSKVGLTELTEEPAKNFIESRGGTLVTGKSVRSLDIDNDTVTSATLSDGTVLTADGFVSALPYEVLLQVLPQEVSTNSTFASINNLSSSPIVGIHIWYDRKIMDQDFVAFLESPIQWVFNRSKIQGDDDGPGQYVTISLSGAWDFVDKPKDELRALFVEEMEKQFPRARGSKVERLLVIKQPRATFRCVPGVAANRPPATTSISNLWLAGEWTDTGWPSTMEGAVRSGVFAAEALASSG